MQAILTLMLAVATPTVDTTATKPNTLQQDFDVASADAASGNCARALPEFESLEKHPKIKPGSLPAAAIAVRKGQCLVNVGRADEGEAAILSGLPTLEKAGDNFNNDVSEGLTVLGDVAFNRWDYGGAARAYQSALALQKGNARRSILARLAKASTFNGGLSALSYAEEGIALVSAMPKPDKPSLAAFHTLHARTLLNQGQVKEAYAELKTALALSGGLTNRTTLSEVSLRSDLAMAAMQMGRKDEARLYLAYTGAGRIEKSPFAIAESMDPPLCGEETGLRRDDVAVVEFSIADNGSVTSAQTVYTRGGPAVAAAFGRAVNEWYWRPKDITAIPPFYRMLTRVELRCSEVLGKGQGVMGPLRQRFLEWATGYLPPTISSTTQNMADTIEAVRKYAMESMSRGDVVAQIAALAWLVDVEPTSRQKRVATADEALALMEKVPVPPEVANWTRVLRSTAASADHLRLTVAHRYALLALSKDPAIAKDALAADTLRLIAASVRLSTEIKEAPELLMAVAQDNRLPEHHSLRQFAWLSLADKAAAAGDVVKAQDYFARTGLSEQQCALLGVAPALQRTGITSSDYPREALMMGFEGWARLEFDITSDGKTTNARPIAAYPPLVFGAAATAITKDFRYESSYRPGQSLACSANSETIKFLNPTNH